jgi:hypothetical protein
VSLLSLIYRNKIVSRLHVHVNVFHVCRLQIFAFLETNASRRVLAMLNLEAAAALSVPSQWLTLYVDNYRSFDKNMGARLRRRVIGNFKKVIMLTVN